MKLSHNFTLAELIKSETAIRRGIDNTPPPSVVENLQQLVTHVLQPIRDRFGPLIVTSGYRSRQLNVAIGGSATSDHVLGMAADIEAPALDNKVLAQYIQNNMKFTQLILEFYTEGEPHSGWVHISYNKDNLKQEVLTAVKRNGKTVYLKGI
jgi:zinc D-Ala-D-Ala carboxypeptidase